jgi:hypothetical protein
MGWSHTRQWLRNKISSGIKFEEGARKSRAKRISQKPMIDLMLWRISKLSFAVIKSSKPHFQPLSAERIAACRTFLGMPAD